MADRSTYLGTGYDYLFDIESGGSMHIPSAGVTLKAWDSKVGGNQYTDLLLNGAAVTSLTVAVADMLNPPAIQGPPGVNDGMWFEATALPTPSNPNPTPGGRVFLTPSHPLAEAKALIPTTPSQVGADAAGAAAAAQAAAAADATTKANNAQAAAISAASSDATSKANNALATATGRSIVNALIYGS